MITNNNSPAIRLLATTFMRSCGEDSSNVKRDSHFLILAILIVAVSYRSAVAQVELIKDLNAIPSENYNQDHMLTHGGDRMYYIDNNQLWTSDGSTNTTSRLKEFKSISNLVAVHGSLYFTADDGISGEELWKTNGTIEGTMRIKDVNPGPASSSPSSVCAVMGRLFFAAKHNSYGRELWTTDGTAAGTLLVRDIMSGLASSNPEDLTHMNGMLYFSANDGRKGRELWTSNGTPTGTHIVRDIVSDYKVGSNPKWITSVNNVLFFTARNANTGLELWKTDGTNAGTHRVKDIRPGAQGSGVKNLINVGGILFFTANDGVHGDELWKSNGSSDGTVLVRDMNPGTRGSNSASTGSAGMNAFTNINGILFFVASQGYDDFIYRSDGTWEGTFPIQISYPTTKNPTLPAFTYLNGKVYFFNSHAGYTPYYLHAMDYQGSAPAIVREFTPADVFDSPFHQEMISFEGNLFTFGRLMTPDWQDMSFSFIRSDGTNDGTTIVKDVETKATLGSNPFRMVRTTDLLYIQTLADTRRNPGKYELFRTDGTAEGTFRIMELGSYQEMVASGNKLFFGAQDGVGVSLYVTEGTTETTTRLTTQFSMINGIPSMLTELHGIVYFAYNYTFEGRPVAIFWKSDGTPEGTRMLQGVTRINSITRAREKVIIIGEVDNGDLFIFKATVNGTGWVASIPSGRSRRSAYQPTAVTDAMYFVATDGEGVHGNEIWRSDGTNAGTYMLIDFNSNDPVNQDGFEDDIRALLAVGKALYFNAKSTDGQWGLHKYVAPSSFEKVADMPPVVHSFVVNRLMYLFTESAHLGRLDVWVSDGTTTGTKVITSIRSDNTINHTVVDGVVYFTSPEAPQMFRSDGTVCGTYEISTGLDRAFPVAAWGSGIVFGAYSPQTGMEPYIYHNISSFPAAVCNPSVQAEINSGTTVFTPYPNPFTDEFTVRVEAVENAKVDIGVKTLQGLNVEKLTGLKTNTDYEHIGRAWPKGIYVLTVGVKNRVTTHRVIKK